MKNKYCRICWNTDGWRKPSGAAKETGDSYYALNGFGHEEWLFNYEWCLDGYKYGFLQPINKFRTTYEGETCSMALYAHVESRSLLVATIREVFVPPLDELRRAFAKMSAQGWVNQMREDVRSVSGKLADLESPLAELVINVRFRPSDVTFVDPMLAFPSDHKTSTLHRYHPLDWEDDLPVAMPDGTGHEPRSELVRVRAAQQATTVDPKHVRLQNRLYSSLCEEFGASAVHYEDDCVDLKVRDTEGMVYFEIKTDSSAKRCIRNAIGQLLEYTSYPSAARAHQWVVVGDAPASLDDRLYLAHLRSRFGLPLYYAQFNWEAGVLGPRC